MKKIIFTLLCLASFINQQAQSTITITIGSGTNVTSTSESSPINIYFKSHHCQILYTAAELNAAGWAGSGLITKLGFNIFGATNEGLPNFSIKLKNTTSSDVVIYDNLGLNTVYTSTTYSPIAGGFEPLTLNSAFVWDGASNLLVDVCFDQVINFSYTGQVYTYTYTSGGAQYKSVRNDYNPQCGIATTIANTIAKPQLQLVFNTLPPCTGSPIAVNATSSNTLVCANTGFDLNLKNSPVTSGLTFQWQSSPNGSIWANLGPIRNSCLYLINSITATTYYRCVTTCTVSAQSVTSAAVTVYLNPLINCYCVPSDPLSIWNCSSEKFIDFSIANIVNQPSYCGTGGYVDSTSSLKTVINLSAGNTYTLSTNTASGGINGNATMGAWIDFNQNGIFDSSEFTYLGLGLAGNYAKTISVPVTAPSGFVKMRLKLDGYNTGSNTIIDPCSNSNNSYSGQIIDYKVNITGAPICTGSVSAGNAISTLTTVCQNVAYTLDLANNSVASGITYQWESSLDGGASWVNLGVAQNTIPYSVASQSIATYYRCATTCSNSGFSNTSTPVIVSQNLPTACYCNPGIVNCASVAIHSVSIANLNYSPKCNSNDGYTNYADSIPAINLNAGQTYNLLTAVTTFSASLDGHVSAWIDYDQNGIFDPSEFISVASYTTGTVSQTFNIPFTTPGGNTKMRIKVESSSINYPGANPCYANSFNGQTLDYLVAITSATPCTGTPFAGDATTSSSSICNNTPFTLDLINNDLALNISYQWQSSANNVTWTNLGASQTSVPYTIPNQNITSYYRCLTTCITSTLSGTSTAIKVTQNPLTACYCVPPPTSCINGDEINSVIFSTLSNTSTCSTNGYIDYAGSVASATIQAGQTYSINVKVGSAYSGKVSSWIDYNQNGVFETTEYKFLGITNSGGNFFVNNSINIPSNALAGNTKIRIRNNNQYILDSSKACLTGGMALRSTAETSPGFGETEDYLLTILPPDCNSIIFPATISVIGKKDICPGDSTTLNLSPALPIATGITYQWKSFNGSAYVNDGIASGISIFAATPSVSTRYYCQILCNGSPVLKSDTVFVNIHTITTAPNTTSVTCNGLTNGAITLNASDFGGTLNYTWTPTEPGNDAVTNLGAGTYTVFISNSINCSISQIFTISQPTSIIATSTQTNVSCYGLNDGAGSVTVAGGTSPLSFSWSPSGGGSLTATNLGAGIYIFNIKDGNNCTLKDTITITQPGSVLVSISGNSSICEQLKDTITSVITGGTGPFIYSWTELPGNVVSNKPDYTYTTSIGTYSYNLSVTDANNCVVNSNTIITVVNQSSNLSGTITTNPSLPVAGTVVLYQYLPFFTKFDSVSSQNIGAAGDYNFTSFTSGKYIIKAIPNANNLQITYGDSAVNWKTAKEIIHGCAVNDIQNINVKALSTFTTTTGTGSLSGKITRGNSYGHRMGFGFKPMAAGEPIGGIIVKGGKNPGGLMFIQTTTDTLGKYTLTGLPDNAGNEEYFIVVDIPGLDTNGTYHKVITLTNNQFINLDFVVDSAKINPINNAVSVHDISAIEHQIKVFPNPATNKVTIQYNLLTNSNVKIELYDIVGKIVKMILPLTEQSNNDYSYIVQLNDIKAGMYFMKLKINNSESIIKLMITE